MWSVICGTESRNRRNNWGFGNMTAGHGIGLLMMFAIAVIPSAILVGGVLGKLLNAPLWLRCTATVACAATLSYVTVFHGGSSPDADCIPASPGIYNTC